ncbi:hypothetical protein A9995_08620 [Erythrobacter sp. QSSC1-22B]|nr:hypothetical protein A9995_08620 [Erythrobacter sp. QSSC1-22B]
MLAAAQAALPAVRRRRAAAAMPREPRWTTARQVAFLTALADTHSVVEAARIAGMSRQSAYRLRTRLRGQPFARAWDAAYTSAPHSLYRAALERAIAGVEMPHYAGGELVGTSRKFDERLTLALLQMPAPPLGMVACDMPGSCYDLDDFSTLLGRVELGPQRFESWETEDVVLALENAGKGGEAGEGEETGDAGEGGEAREEDPLTPGSSPWRT